MMLKKIFIVFMAVLIIAPVTSAFASEYDYAYFDQNYSNFNISESDFNYLIDNYDYVYYFTNARTGVTLAGTNDPDVTFVVKSTMKSGKPYDYIVASDGSVFSVTHPYYGNSLQKDVVKSSDGVDINLGSPVLFMAPQEVGVMDQVTKIPGMMVANLVDGGILSVALIILGSLLVVGLARRLLYSLAR